MNVELTIRIREHCGQTEPIMSSFFLYPITVLHAAQKIKKASIMSKYYKYGTHRILINSFFGTPQVELSYHLTESIQFFFPSCRNIVFFLLLARNTRSYGQCFFFFFAIMTIKNYDILKITQHNVHCLSGFANYFLYCSPICQYFFICTICCPTFVKNLQLY